MTDSDDSHSESEFYYPEELDENAEENKENDADSFNMTDVQHFIEGQRPENTVKKTHYDLKSWKRYLTSLKEEREIEHIPAEQLNILICRFFMDVRKKDGGPYEPSTLTSYQRSLQRYLNDKGSKLNILKDQEFSKSREVLSSKKKQLVEESAKGNRPRAARELCEEEEDLLFTSGEFGDQNPEALQITLWWLLSLQFGFRARDESRKLKWGDISLITDGTTGNEVLHWTGERGSKTRHGDGSRAFNPTAQATNNERCPVKFYKSFKSHRPEEMMKPDSPFFLAINHRRTAENQVWYSKAPLGKNEIGKFMPTAAKRAGLTGNVTNHSVRKTCISRLMDAEVPVNYVAQLSGHKNLKSLDAYKTASTEHQRHMSLVLSRSATNEANPGPLSTRPASTMVDTGRNSEVIMNKTSTVT